MSPRVVTKAQQLVPLTEVGVQMGGAGAEVVVARLALAGHPAAVEDWQGRLSIPPELAAKVVTAYQDEVEEAEARRAAYASYLAGREQARRTAGQVAFEEAARAAHERSRRSIDADFAGFVGHLPADNTHTRAAGRDAAREALEQFDARHPVIPIDRFEP